ncbi:MFS transporter [Sphaerisporangium rhizosphaerae]|uniref:MFS transporter n=1 Tax=Sphaerisporangium rhizosphaerae TaxID=2269375 RepID=A0ABW2P185_9ACTN
MVGRRLRRRMAAPAHRDLWLFFVGEATSLLGSAMASLALAFALLGGGGTQSELGYVMAARIVPMVVLMPFAGVVADRVGPRRVMVSSDVLRCVTQAILAVLLLAGRPPLWAFVALVTVWGAGEAFFMPARGALIPRVAAGGDRYAGKLRDANALAGLAQSLASVSGPALAGVAVAALGPGAVVALDAGTYAVSAVALMLLRLAGPGPPPVPAMRGRAIGELAEGWRHFRAHSWLWVTTLQFTLFNMLVWAPFLVLGPVVAQERLGGAGAWGLIMACYGGGAVGGGLAMMGGRAVRRPLLVATVATFGWALPSGAIAAGAPVAVIATGALVAGAGSAVCGTLYATTNQRYLPAGVLARVTSLTGVGAFVLGPVGLAVAGPAASAAGVTGVLAFGAVWQAVACCVVLAVPGVRGLPAAPAGVEDADAAATTEEAARV